MQSLRERTLAHRLSTATKDQEYFEKARTTMCLESQVRIETSSTAEKGRKTDKKQQQTMVRLQTVSNQANGSPKEERGVQFKTATRCTVRPMRSATKDMEKWTAWTGLLHQPIRFWGSEGGTRMFPTELLSWAHMILDSAGGHSNLSTLSLLCGPEARQAIFPLPTPSFCRICTSISWPLPLLYILHNEQRYSTSR